jgi:hypothetical protein
MQNSDLVRQYEELLTKTLKDPVDFARTFLTFQPYP